MHYYRGWIALLLLCLSGCTKVVPLKSVDFEVKPDANQSTPFVCHIAISYKEDVDQILQGLDSKDYFSKVSDFKNKYKNSLICFSYDLIPGKNKIKQKIQLDNRKKAIGAYIFAKYINDGKFAEHIDSCSKLLVQFSEYNMTLQNDETLKSWNKKNK